MPITKRGKGWKRKGWKDVVIKKDFVGHFLDIKQEISKRKLDMSLEHIAAF